jgi:hypothetical protein
VLELFRDTPPDDAADDDDGADDDADGAADDDDAATRKATNRSGYTQGSHHIQSVRRMFRLRLRFAFCPFFVGVSSSARPAEPPPAGEEEEEEEEEEEDGRSGGLQRNETGASGDAGKRSGACNNACPRVPDDRQ